MSTNVGIALNAVWKQRKAMWYVVESAIEKNIVDRLTPRQFHEAIEKVLTQVVKLLTKELALKKARNTR